MSAVTWLPPHMVAASSIITLWGWAQRHAWRSIDDEIPNISLADAAYDNRTHMLSVYRAIGVIQNAHISRQHHGI